MASSLTSLSSNSRNISDELHHLEQMLHYSMSPGERDRIKQRMKELQDRYYYEKQRDPRNYVGGLTATDFDRQAQMNQAEPPKKDKPVKKLPDYDENLLLLL